MNYLNEKTQKIAEYDSFMGLYYIEGEYYTDGTMIPFRKDEIENSNEWKKISKNDE